MYFPFSSPVLPVHGVPISESVRDSRERVRGKVLGHAQVCVCSSREDSDTSAEDFLHPGHSPPRPIGGPHGQVGQISQPLARTGTMYPIRASGHDTSPNRAGGQNSFRTAGRAGKRNWPKVTRFKGCAHGLAIRRRLRRSTACRRPRERSSRQKCCAMPIIANRLKRFNRPLQAISHICR